MANLRRLARLPTPPALARCASGSGSVRSLATAASGDGEPSSSTAAARRPALSEHRSPHGSVSRGRQLLLNLRSPPPAAPPPAKPASDFGLATGSAWMQESDPPPLTTTPPPRLAVPPAVSRRPDNQPLEHLERLLGQRRATTDYAHNHMDKRLTKRIWEAYLLVEDHKDITPELWSAILEGVVPKALNAAQVWRKSDKSPNSRTSKKLTRYHTQGFAERLERVLSDILSVGLRPRERDYLFVLGHFSKAGSWRGAERMVETLVAEGYPLSEEVFHMQLEAMGEFLKRYDSNEAVKLERDGLLPPKTQTWQAVAENVNLIMTKVQQANLPLILPPRLVDEACMIYGRLGDFEKLNALARWGYGVDLDVPDAIPQEWIDRVEDGSELSRGVRSPGLRALLNILLAAGRPWQALSVLEVASYDTAVPAHLHPSLSRQVKPETDAADAVESYYRFAPPLPPTSAIAMMNLRPTVIAPPRNYMQSTSSLFGQAAPATVPSPASPSQGVMYELLEPERRFPRPSVAHGTVTWAIMLGGIRSSKVEGRLALYKHVLQRALAGFYEDRQRLTGELLRMLSRADAADRQREMQSLGKRRQDVRHRWFAPLDRLSADLPPRERFELLGWAEDELRHWRLTVEMDRAILEKAKRILHTDRLEAVAQMKTPEGYPVQESDNDTRVASTDFPRINLLAELRELHHGWTTAHETFRALAAARVRAAWADLGAMHALLAQGFAPAHALEDGTTVGSRVAQYTHLLAERLSWELAPARDAFDDPLDVVGAFGAFAGLVAKNAFTETQMKQTNSFFYFPTADVPNLFELPKPAYEAPFSPALAAREAEMDRFYPMEEPRI